jgi:F0F1-type ATP synthase assembly protein I
MPQNKEQVPSNKQLLLKYAGLATQLLVALSLGVWLGYYVDKWFKLSFPIFIWSLPLIFLMAMFYQILKDTSKK